MSTANTKNGCGTAPLLSPTQQKELIQQFPVNSRNLLPQQLLSQSRDVNSWCLFKGTVAALSGRGCPTHQLFFFFSLFALPVCVLSSERAKEKQSPERISSMLTVGDPHGSCMLKLGRAGPASSNP